MTLVLTRPSTPSSPSPLRSVQFGPRLTSGQRLTAKQLQLSAVALEASLVAGDEATALMELTLDKMTLDEDLSPRRKRKRSNAVLVRVDVEPPKKSLRAHRRMDQRGAAAAAIDEAQEQPSTDDDDTATSPIVPTSAAGSRLEAAQSEEEVQQI